MSEQNKQVVVRFIEAMGKSDAATAAACLAPDAFTVAKGFGKFAGVRHYDQIVGTIDWFKQLMPGGLRPTIHASLPKANEWRSSSKATRRLPTASRIAINTAWCSRCATARSSRSTSISALNWPTKRCIRWSRRWSNSHDEADWSRVTPNAAAQARRPKSPSPHLTSEKLCPVQQHRPARFNLI